MMLPPLIHPSHIVQLVEEARIGLEALEAAAIGIAAGMRASTMDPDGAYHLLHTVSESMRVKLDRVTDALADQRYARAANEITSAPSRNFTK